jgi:WD40 repeat protein
VSAQRFRDPNRCVKAPAGTRLLTVDKTAQLWDAEGGAPIGPAMYHRGWVWSVAFSPTDSVLVTGGDDRISRLWTTSGSQIGKPMSHPQSVSSVGFSPHGMLILTPDVARPVVRPYLACSF